jgi:hypothetical protein
VYKILGIYQTINAYEAMVKIIENLSFQRVSVGEGRLKISKYYLTIWSSGVTGKVLHISTMLEGYNLY